MTHSGPTTREKGKWLPILIFKLGDFDKSISCYFSADSLGFHWSKQSGDTGAFLVVCLVQAHPQMPGGERTKQSHAELTWLRSSAAERRGGDGSVLGSCSPLLCFLPRKRHLLFDFKWVTLINLPLVQTILYQCFSTSTWQPTALFSVHVFSETSGFTYFLFSTGKSNITETVRDLTVQ